MPEPHPPHSRDLPPYRAVVVVDVKNFTEIPSAYQLLIHRQIPDVLKLAFAKSGLAEEWAGKEFPSDTGDGYIAGIPPSKLPTLIDPFIGNLQEVLADTDRTLRAVDRKLRMRMRLSIHVGPLPDEGIGKPMNDTHRLLDSVPVRTELNTSSPDVTFLAAIISDRAFQDAVADGYTGLRQEAFRPVTATVPNKNFTEKAWLYIPALSYGGEPPQDQAGDDGGPSGTQPPSGPAPNVRNEFSGGSNHGSVLQAGNIGRIGNVGGSPERKGER